MEWAAEADGTGQYRPPWGHRHADLDETTGIGRTQRADRSDEVAKTGVPFGRAGQAQDIANGVLASDVSSYMTVIDDGMTGGARPRWGGIPG
jgi:hypothetical protein